MSDDTLAVIDGDQIAYVAAAANEKRSIIAKCADTEVEFSTRTAMKKWIAKQSDGPSYEDYSIEDVQSPASIHFAYKTMREKIDHICEAVGANKYHIVVSGDTNFRMNIPLPKQYKSNRKNSLRPLQLKECKQYLIDKYNAEVSVNCEADDVLTQYAWSARNSSQKVVVCTYDKDHAGTACSMYNTQTGELHHISGFGSLFWREKENDVKGYGRAFFWWQCLIGDKSDGYDPRAWMSNPPKFGEKSAWNIMKDCKTDKEALQVVYNKYKEWYPSPVTYTAWDGREYTVNHVEILQMIVDAAHMCRFEGDCIVIENVLDKLQIIR